MTAFEIIKLAPEAWAEYRALRLEMLLAEPQAYGISYADSLQRPDAFWEERLRAAALGQDQWMYFARAAGALVGMVGAFRKEADDVAHVVSMYVRAACRGQGIARALLDALLADLKQAGLRQAALGVNANQLAAVKLYREMGFAILSAEEDTMGDGVMYPAYWMAKDL